MILWSSRLGGTPRARRLPDCTGCARIDDDQKDDLWPVFGPASILGHPRAFWSQWTLGHETTGEPAIGDGRQPDGLEVGTWPPLAGDVPEQGPRTPSGFDITKAERGTLLGVTFPEQGGPSSG